jgi:DNA topoisomerase-3
MAEIAQMAERIVRKAKEYDRDTIPGDYATLEPPRARTAAAWSRRTTAASPAPAPPAGRGLRLLASRKIPAGRSLRDRRGRDLPARAPQIGPLEGFRSKAGWPFTAELRLVRDDEIGNWKLEFDFGEDGKRRRRPTASRWTSPARSPWAPCPDVQGPRLRARHHLRLRAQRAAPTPLCDFKSGKIILQQPGRARGR